MANRNLIAGTRAVYGNRFVDAAGAVGAGMKGYGSGTSLSTLANLASMKKTDAQVKAYMEGLNTEMDLLNQINVNKTNAVAKFPKLNNVRQIQNFLGLIGYFRKFILNYARVVRPHIFRKIFKIL